MASKFLLCWYLSLDQCGSFFFHVLAQFHNGSKILEFLLQLSSYLLLTSSYFLWMHGEQTYHCNLAPNLPYWPHFDAVWALYLAKLFDGFICLDHKIHDIAIFDCFFVLRSTQVCSLQNNQLTNENTYHCWVLVPDSQSSSCNSHDSHGCD